jgi:hypothetical protein
MSSYHDGWFSSTSSEYENPEMFPPPNYPVNLSSQTNLSQELYCSGYDLYGSSSATQHTDTNGQDDVDDDEDNDVEIEEIRGRRLSWTEEDNIRLVSNFAELFFLHITLSEKLILHTFFKKRVEIKSFKLAD